MRKVPFDGIVAASDLIALGGIRALHRAGVDVPRDVSVVGYDNNLLSRLSTPTLSTVQQDIPKAGRMLVSKLLEWSGAAAAGDVVDRAHHPRVLRGLIHGSATPVNSASLAMSRSWNLGSSASAAGSCRLR